MNFTNQETETPLEDMPTAPEEEETPEETPTEV